MTERTHLGHLIRVKKRLRGQHAPLFGGRLAHFDGRRRTRATDGYGRGRRVDRTLFRTPGFKRRRREYVVGRCGRTRAVEERVTNVKTTAATAATEDGSTRICRHQYGRALRSATCVRLGVRLRSLFFRKPRCVPSMSSVETSSSLPKRCSRTFGVVRLGLLTVVASDNDPR